MFGSYLRNDVHQKKQNIYFTVRFYTKFSIAWFGLFFSKKLTKLPHSIFALVTFLLLFSLLKFGS